MILFVLVSVIEYSYSKYLNELTRKTGNKLVFYEIG